MSMSDRSDICSVSVQRSRRSNRGRGIIRVSAQQRFIDIKRKLRKVHYATKEHDQSKHAKKEKDNIPISDDLKQWIDHYESRDKMVRIHIDYDHFKDARKGDLHVECLQKDVFIKKWKNINTQMYNKHIANVIGDDVDDYNTQRLKAIAKIGFGRSESFVDVYSDYIESSVPISEKCFDFIGFKQLMREYAPINITDFDVKTVWFQLTEDANHEIITKQQWRRYKQAHFTDDANDGISSRSSFLMDEDEKENLQLDKMNFSQFKELYYKNVIGKNVKNLFELRKYWRENLNEDQTGTISAKQWNEFIEKQKNNMQMKREIPKKETLHEKRRYKFDIRSDPKKQLSQQKPRHDSSWIRHSKNQNIEPQTVRQIQKKLGDRLCPVTTEKYRQSIQAFHERESKYKALKAHWEQPETPARPSEMYSNSISRSQEKHESELAPRSTHATKSISIRSTAKPKSSLSRTNTISTNMSSLNISNVPFESDRVAESEDTPSSITSGSSFNISLDGISGEANDRRRFRPTFGWIPKEEILRKSGNRKRFGNTQMINDLPSHLRNLYEPATRSNSSNSSWTKSHSVRFSKSTVTTKVGSRNSLRRAKTPRTSVFHQFNLKPFPLPCLVSQNTSIDIADIGLVSRDRFLAREKPKDFIALKNASSSSTPSRH